MKQHVAMATMTLNGTAIGLLRAFMAPPSTRYGIARFFHGLPMPAMALPWAFHGPWLSHGHAMTVK